MQVRAGFRPAALAAVLFTAFAIMVFPGPREAAAREDDFSATIIEISGSVAVLNPDRPEWIPAVRDMPLGEGLVIRTGEDSSVEILLDDGSHLRLDQNSELSIDELVIDEKDGFIKSTLVLWAGRVLSSVAALRNRDSSYEVRTVNSVAGVRGTQFLVELPKNDETLVCVYEGEVDVSAGAETPAPERMVKVPAGMETMLRGWAAPMRPYRLSPAMEKLRPVMRDLKIKARALRKKIREIKERRDKLPPELLQKLKRAKKRMLRKVRRLKRAARKKARRSRAAGAAASSGASGQSTRGSADP